MWSSACDIFDKNRDDQIEKTSKEETISSVTVRIGKIFWLIIFFILVMVITGMWISIEVLVLGYRNPNVVDSIITLIWSASLVYALK